MNETTPFERTVYKKTKKAFFLRVVLILVATHAAVGYGAWKIGAARGDVRAPMAVQEFNEEEAQDIIDQVSRLMVLPTDEKPRVIKINNAPQVAQEQPFFIGAQNGDIFIAYYQAKKAIIYRPDQKVIVNVGPIYDDQAPAAAPAVNERPAENPTPQDTAAPEETEANADTGTDVEESTQ